jgi:hypothetical protein
MGCNISPTPTYVSPAKNSWMLHTLDKVSLGYFAPDRTITSLNSDLIERSDTRLLTAAHFSAANRWSSICGPSVHPTEGRQSNKPGQGRRQSRPDASLIHYVPEAAAAADGASSMLDAVQGRDTSVRGTISVMDPDPGSGAFLTLGSGMGRKSASGSGIRDEQPGSYFLQLRNHFFGFFGVKILNSA